MNNHKRRFFQSEAGATAFQKMLGFGLFLCSAMKSTRFDFFSEALAAGKDAKFVEKHPYCIAWRSDQEN